MKQNIYILLFLLNLSTTLFGQDYYWYGGKQIPLHRGNQRYVIYEDNNAKEVDVLPIIKNGSVSYPNKTNLKWGIVAQSETIKAKNVLYQTPSFLCFDSIRNMYLTHRFYVKLKSKDKFAHLQLLLNKYNAGIEQEGDFPLWYIISCGLNSQYNALELANIFYESGSFAECEPEFINAAYFDCVNDTKFNKQWNLKNTGQSWLWSNLVDINYCEAHSITSGNSSVIIGVYDRGVELTHPDINTYSFSYDANTKSSPSTIYYNENNVIYYHGIACAGIIGAKTDNNLGVAGIAPDCPIMSLSFDSTCTSKNLGAGFKVAADSGCSVISNSWHWGSYSPYIKEGISYALSHGRNGKGCVVVFSAGNENHNGINYPANSNDSIIVVGAMSPCGERKNPYSCDHENWGSNFGVKLDIMAPGVQIPTTDITGSQGANQTDYMENFRGTSAACPHVSAVAGLMLSVNPYLTRKEVVDIIESTAQKVGSYNYTVHSGRPNGTWNDTVGYGLVDAYAAVSEAQNRCPVIQGPDYICMGDTVCFQLLNAPANATFSWTATMPLEAAGRSYDIVQGQGTSTLCVAAVDHEWPYIPILSRGYSPIISPVIPPITPRGIIKVEVTLPDNTTYTIKKTMRSPHGETPIINTDSLAVWHVGTERIFTVANCVYEPDSVLVWTVKRGLLTLASGTGWFFPYTPLLQGPQTISVTNTNKECGEATASRTFFVSRKVRMDVTNGDNILTIRISEDSKDSQRTATQLNASSTYTIELWHSIYGLMKNQAVQSTDISIDTTGLPQGVYVVLLKENGEVIAQTKVQL